MSRVYFTDRDLGKQFPRLLADAGIAFERHADRFPPAGSVPDEAIDQAMADSTSASAKWD